MKQTKRMRRHHDPTRPEFICPDCGQPKQSTSARCRACDTLHRQAGVTGSPFCPSCDGRKQRQSLLCATCAGNVKGDSLYEMGRHESLITFSNTATGELYTHHCVGEGKPAQIAAGLAYLAELDPDAEWVVSSRCTPQTILHDMRRDLRNRPTGGRRA